MDVSDRNAAQVGAALAALLGVFLVVLSWQPLSRIFAADRDNVFVVYLGLGLPLLLPGLWLLVYAAKTLLRLRRSADGPPRID
jgi:hypothetical protein